MGIMSQLGEEEEGKEKTPEWHLGGSAESV